MVSPLSALSDIISSGIGTIESTYAKHGSTFPSLNDPFQSGPFDGDAKFMEVIDHVVAAASQLIALVTPPPATILESSFAFHLPASLGVVVQANIPEILREAGPQGLHVTNIGDKCGADPHKIGRVLRYLATKHIFREASPDIFANNRLSSVMDTGKSVSALKADPMSKHDDTLGLPAVVGFCTDEIMKAGVNLQDNLLDPKTAFSHKLHDSPLARTFNCGSVFDLLERPENVYRLRRFGAAMHGSHMASNFNAVMTTFDWKSLKRDDLVVDVGGGIGSSTQQLLEAYPHLRYAIQDRPQVIPNGIKFWDKENPDALKSGKIRLQEHDFFQPQPIKDASVFFLRMILHDWPDANARKILTHLRRAAQPSTKLIVCDILVPYAASSDHDGFSDIPGSSVTSAPYPLLPNAGNIMNQAVMADMQMMVTANSQERTIGQFVSLVSGTGWELGSIGRSPGNSMILLIFNPVAL